jgi:hypothetical protein
MKKENNFILSPRIIRSPKADFYGGDIESALDAYSDEYLREVSEMGYNGVWLHGELRHLVATNLFSNAGTKQTDILRRLVKKVSKYGLKVYLYILEPRAMKESDPFWKKHSNLKGQPHVLENCGPELDGLWYALCSSMPEVKEYLEEGMYRLFKSVPGLGGIFCITASELHTHCYSHYPRKNEKYNFQEFYEWGKGDFVCPLCAERTPSDVVAEVITLLNRGVKRASPDADVIAWTWSWVIIEKDPQKSLISKLPRDVILMSDWERGGSKKVLGKTYVVDEYSLSLPGPSGRYKNQLKIAKSRGMRMMAKLQFGTTHELASIPYLPVPHLLAKKFEGLKKNKVDGFLACWIFGGAPSPMTKLAAMMSRKNKLSSEQVINQLAIEEFGKSSSSGVVRAWKKFAEAWKEFPFSVTLLYNGPMTYATAYPLSLDLKKVPTIPGWLALPRDKKGHLCVGDNLDSWITPFTPELLVKAFVFLQKIWNEGIVILENALKTDADNHRLKLEWNLAKHISLSISSTMNILRFYPLYRKYQNSTGGQKQKLHEKIMVLFKEELDITVQDRDCVRFDTRIGYHAEAFCHIYTLDDMDYKIRLLKKIGKI